MNILNGLLFSLYYSVIFFTGLYIGLQKYGDFQSETKVKQIIVTVTAGSISCFNLNFRFN